MLKIEYEIQLNETGRPCIELSKDYEDKSEDKFFAIELARYFLQGVYNRRTSILDKQTIDMMDIAIRLLGQIGDEMAHIIYDSMVAMGDVDFLIGNKYHHTVKSIEERDKIENIFVVNGKIFKREVGLKIYVIDESTIYELKNGITNENWEIL